MVFCIDETLVDHSVSFASRPSIVWSVLVSALRLQAGIVWSEFIYLFRCGELGRIAGKRSPSSCSSHGNTRTGRAPSTPSTQDGVRMPLTLYSSPALLSGLKSPERTFIASLHHSQRVLRTQQILRRTKPCANPNHPSQYD